MSLYLKWIYYWYHIVRFAFLTQYDNIHLWIGVFKTFTFNVIWMVVLISTILLCIFYLSNLFFVLFYFLPCFILIKYPFVIPFFFAYLLQLITVLYLGFPIHILIYQSLPSSNIILLYVRRLQQFTFFSTHSNFMLLLSHIFFWHML